MRNRLVIMVKAPQMGRVKTRLGRSIGAVAATWFYRVSLERLVRALYDPRWDLVLAVAPDTALSWPWPGRAALAAQGNGDLGVRMQRLFDDMPPGPVVIIGSDIPAVCKGHVARAFRALGSHDGVIGPAPDGGYWLIGLKRRPAIPRAFSQVRWSSMHTFKDTLHALSGKSIALIDMLEDVDDGAAYLRWRKGDCAPHAVE